LGDLKALEGYSYLILCLFFVTFRTELGTEYYAEIKSPTEIASEAFASADTGYQAVGTSFAST